ncbi:MAG: hypothetical protein RI885_1609 [Actinomycetota bacterium]
MNRAGLRDHVPSVIVAALASAFGVALLQTTGLLARIIAADDVTGDSATVAVMLQVLATVFIAIAVYVGAVVTANTVATIIAGRIRTIALLRVIGSSASAQRRAIAREGLVAGIVGGALGAVAGWLLVIVVVAVGSSVGFLDDVDATAVQSTVLLPVVAVVLTTWSATWSGSRRVLTVSPIQAAGAAVESTREQAAGHRGRNAVALILAVAGTLLLGAGVFVGLVDPLGVLVGLVGGMLSFTGLVLGADRIMPPMLRIVGRMFGRSAPARLAAENAVRYPERSSRTTIGLVIGVTLVTMFAVALASYGLIIREAQRAQPEVYQGVDEVLVITLVVFSVLLGFSALIAAVGMINNLSLSVLQRRRELGLLRALGFTAAQVRLMILAESAQLSLASVLLGLVLGTAYGWVGAQSLLGSITGGPGLVVPVVPVELVIVMLVGGAVLSGVASVVPVRRATGIAPVAALAVD